MTVPLSCDVLIVGAGVAGLSTALGLRDSGLNVVLVDKEISADGRILGWGNDIQPNGLQALDTLGVLDEVKRTGVLHYYWYAQRSGDGVMSQWDYAILGHPHSYAVCIRPHLLRRVLRSKLEHSGMLMAGEFLGMRRHDEGYEVDFETVDGLRPIRTRMLVGADGPYSQVRTAAGLPCNIRRYRTMWANTILRKDAGDIPEGHVFFGRNIYLGLVPTQSEELVMFHITRARTHDEYRAQFGSLAKLRQHYVEIAPLLECCIGNLRSWKQVSCPPSVRVRASRWVSDGLAVVGDAALNVNPVTSQGASLALESGLHLSAVLKECFAKGDRSARALLQYEAACRPAAELIQTLGDRSLLLFGNGNRILSALKMRILSRIESDSEMKLKFMGAFCGLNSLVPDSVGLRDALIAGGFWPRSRQTDGRITSAG